MYILCYERLCVFRSLIDNPPPTPKKKTFKELMFFFLNDYCNSTIQTGQMLGPK